MKTMPVWAAVDLQNGFPFASDDFKPFGATPLIRIRDLTAKSWETHLAIDVPDEFLVENGDVVIGMDGDFNVVRWSRGRAALNQRLCRLRSRSGHDLRFVEYALPLELQRIHATQHATTVKHLSSGEILHSRIPARDLEDQRRIADFLDDQVGRIDNIIAARRQQIATSHQLRSMRAKTWTTGNTVQGVVPTGIAWMPTIAPGWGLPRVAHIFRTGSGITPTTTEQGYFGGDVPWVTTTDVRDGRLSSTTKSVTKKALEDFPTLVRYHPGALVVAMYGQGATKGRVALLDISACVNQACCVLMADNRTLTEWAFYWFRAYKAEIVQLALGAGQPNLSQDIVRSLRIPMPDTPTRLRLLQELSQSERQINEQIASMEAQIRLLEEFKQSLTTAAVTGELDVTTARKEVPA